VRHPAGCSAAALGALQVRLAHRFEEGLALLLETVQAATGSGAGQAHFHRQVEDQGQVRAQVALDEGSRVAIRSTDKPRPPP
jgi:hypothetical protein